MPIGQPGSVTSVARLGPRAAALAAARVAHAPPRHARHRYMPVTPVRNYRRPEAHCGCWPLCSRTRRAHPPLRCWRRSCWWWCHCCHRCHYRYLVLPPPALLPWPSSSSCSAGFSCSLSLMLLLPAAATATAIAPPTIHSFFLPPILLLLRWVRPCSCVRPALRCLSPPRPLGSRPPQRAPRPRRRTTSLSAELSTASISRHQPAEEEKDEREIQSGQ